MISALFVREDSVYKTLPGVDAWDQQRDARRWPGGNPLVAHPPCRAWSCLRYFARPEPGEKDLAFFAVDMIRRWGGVLEHPRGSALWPAAGLPLPGKGKDAFGGWSIGVNQYWWGHRAEKATLLYVVGVEPRKIPEIPFVLGEPLFVVSSIYSKKRGDRHPSKKFELPKAEREKTPPRFAEWLVELASLCHGGKNS